MTVRIQPFYRVSGCWTCPLLQMGTADMKISVRWDKSIPGLSYGVEDVDAFLEGGVGQIVDERSVSHF